jgi:hypothetical protein
MKVNIFDFPVGSATTNTAMEANLGSIATQGNKMYRLVKSNGSIASPSGKVVTSAYDSTGKTWNVNFPTALQVAADGIIPSDYGTTTIATSTYFWIQISGVVSATCASTTALYNTAIVQCLSGNTSGLVTVFTAVSDPATVSQATIGIALNTAVVTASGDTIKVQLRGLI